MEDRAIIDLLLAHDEAGLRAAEEACGAYCRRLAENLLGSGEDAEECWSDALLRLWNAVPPEEPRRLRAYLAKLTRAAAIDRLRSEKAQKRGGGSLPLLLDELAECLPGEGDAESETLTRELGEAVGRWLRGQSARDRALFVGRYFRGEPPEALGRRFGMRPNAVSAALGRCRRRLRAHLEKEGFIP